MFRQIVLLVILIGSFQARAQKEASVSASVALEVAPVGGAAVEPSSPELSFFNPKTEEDVRKMAVTNDLDSQSADPVEDLQSAE